MKVKKFPRVPDSSAASYVKQLYAASGREFETLRKRNALKFFRSAASDVPAYLAFLKKNCIASARVKNFSDFQKLPITSKKDYLKKNSRPSLVHQGDLKKSLTWTSTSGSTGTPFYFPRTSRIDFEYSVIAEAYIRQNIASVTGPTLVLDCLGMGVWIAGLLSFEAFHMVAERGYPLSLLAPGLNKPEIFKALKNLAPDFAQTIILGYPPFVKDILDGAAAEGIDLRKLNMRILTGAEGYSESFRDYMVEAAGARSPLLDTLNVYGSADIGTMAFETPIAILARRIACADPEIFRDLFGGVEKTPTLAQYNPNFVIFEEQDGEILLSGDSAMPLIRYAIGDRGGVHSFEGLCAIFSSHGVDLLKEAKAAGIAPFVYQLPFVYVFERTDFSVSLYGLQIYPEHVREGLLRREVVPYATGKFSMEVSYDNAHNQQLSVHVELQPNVTAAGNLASTIASAIIEGLKERSGEYRELLRHLGEKALPKITLWLNASAPHFGSGGKQKWVVPKQN
jgi:phenylacetate-CoA ligase